MLCFGVAHLLVLRYSSVILLRQPRSTLFPYTTLFRSADCLRRESCTGNHFEGRTPIVRPSVPRGTDGRTIGVDRKSTRLNSSHLGISYAVFCLKKKTYSYEHTVTYSTSLLQNISLEYV